MVETDIVERGIKDLRLTEVMSRIPRHLFVIPSMAHKAYGSHPLPIGEGQTISQPSVQAMMTASLEVTEDDRVLEIGTGSGYQTAILAELACQVFTIERIKSLGRAAKERLDGMGYTNINYRVTDGTTGWRDQGPYDAILVTAAGPEVPKILVEQLKEGGRLVAPVGEGDQQEIHLVTRTATGTRLKNLGTCKFVPLIGKYGHPE